MNKQQLKLHAHFSRLLVIFHERELIILGLMINLSIIALFGLASNSFHLQTYAQLFEGREFETPQQPEGCNGRCVYSYNSGSYYKKEEQLGGGIGFTPCQSATYCGGSGSSTNEQALCGTAAGCSYTGSNGNTIFCAGNKCTECTSGGRCTELDPKRYPSSIQNPPASGWSGSNYNGTCSGPGCAPGTVPPTTNPTCSPNCPASFANTNNGYGGGTTIIGDQVIKFDAGSQTSTDGKYTRTCSASGSCTVSPVTGGGSSGGSGGSTPVQTRTYHVDYFVPPAGACSTNGSLCNFTASNGAVYNCSQIGSTGAYGCDVTETSTSANSSGNAITQFGTGTLSNPYVIAELIVDSPNRANNPCLGASGDCYVRSNQGLFLCAYGGTCRPVSNQSGANSGQNQTSPEAGAVGGFGSGTYNDPYDASSVAVLINLCSTATSGCYGMIDGVKYECQKGSCGPARTPPGEAGSPVSGNESGPKFQIPLQKDNIGPKEMNFTWPGTYGFSAFSVNGTAVQPAFVCGDLVCSGNETPASCPQDCGGSNIACTVGASRRLVCE